MQNLRKVIKTVPQRVFFITVAAVFALLALYIYGQYRETQVELNRLKANPQALSVEDRRQLIERVGALVVLPEGEEPTVGTVNDVERLRSQPFFTKAQNGDKVLLYYQAKKAYLYRPGINKVVDIAPVVAALPSVTPQASASAKSK